jgi:superfamily II DNA/RNA helicase
MSHRTPSFGRGAAFSSSRIDSSAASTRDWGIRPNAIPYHQHQESDRRPPPPSGATEYGSNRNSSPPPPLPPRGAGTRLINVRQQPPPGYEYERRPEFSTQRFLTREQALYAPPQNHSTGQYDDVALSLHTAVQRPPSRGGLELRNAAPAEERRERHNYFQVPPSSDRPSIPPANGYVNPTQNGYDRASTQQSNASQRHQYGPLQHQPLQGPDSDRIHPPSEYLHNGHQQPPNFGRQQPLHYTEQQNRRQQPPSSQFNENIRSYESQNQMGYERLPTRPPHDYRNAAPIPLPRTRNDPETRNGAPVEERRDYQNYFAVQRRTPPLPINSRYNDPDESFVDENEDRAFNSQSSAATIRANPYTTVAYNGPANPRGGYNGNGRGGYSGRNDVNGAANGGFDPVPRSNRYDDRRNSDAPASNGYRGFQQLDSHSTDRQRAQKGYVPQNRNIDEIFDEDSQDVNRHANTIFDADADIDVEGVDVPQRCERWEVMGLDNQLMQNIFKSEYRKPRNIQQYVIPYMMDRFNIKCQSETGSGKTAAFLIPLVHNLIKDKERNPLPTDGPICLIISPTRELTQQLYEQAKKFATGTNITVSYAYGQVDTAKNLADIRRKGCNILCCCLGRLIDFVESSHITLKYVRYLVIDEADRLMDNKEDNFGILKLLNFPQLPKKEERQTCLFSATLKDPVLEQLSNEYINDYNRLFIVAKSETNVRIKYLVLAVPSIPAKFRYLLCYLNEIVEQNNGICPRVLIFVNRKINVDRVAIDITGAGFPATTIHGDRGQDLREEALASFKSGKTRCLVATDVCARGVDIKDMDYVINYDLPEDKASFIQRCGRTGRSHNGVAVSFYCEGYDKNMAHIIDSIIQDAGQESPAFLRSNVTDSDYVYEPREQVQSYSHREAGPSPIDSGRYSQNVSPDVEEQQIPDDNVDEEWN